MGTWLGIFALTLAYALLSGCQRGEQVSANIPESDIPRVATQILETRCGSCHNPSKSNSGGFDYLSDHARLIKTEMLVPFDAKSSLLYQRIVDASMPPKSFFNNMSDTEKDVIRKWIDLGAKSNRPDASAQVPKIDLGFQEGHIKEIQEDYLSLPEAERKLYRYVTALPMVEEGYHKNQITRARLALDKMLNSVTWEKKIVIAQPLLSGLSYRIKLGDYGWDREVWEQISAGSDLAYKFDRVTDDCACLPVVRIDWLVRELAYPEKYYRALKMPPTFNELEKRLGIAMDRNVKEKSTLRLGILHSFIAKNYRVLERQPIEGHRAIWRSFEFSNKAGRANILEHPLGPTAAGFGSKESFVNVSQETIFDLPNGLHGYAIHDSKGRIVSYGGDAGIQEPEKNRNAAVPVSCFRCHPMGLSVTLDEIRSFYEFNQAYKDRPSAAKVLNLYKDQGIVAEAFHKDNANFSEVLKKLGIRPEDPEPIAAVVNRYEVDRGLRKHMPNDIPMGAPSR